MHRRKELFVLVSKGPEGYSRDLVFERTTVRESENDKYLDGIRDLTATQEAGLTKI